MATRMVVNVFAEIKKALLLAEYRLNAAIGFDKSPDLISLEAINGESTTRKAETPSILDSIIDNGFLWGVPDHRRTVELRRSRKLTDVFLIKPKKNIIACNVCGHYHEGHTICGNCYEKVKLETKAMQDAIQKTLKLDPVDQEVVVLYENENKKEDFYQGKRIVELERPTPPWFTRNLLTRTHEPKSLEPTSSKLTVPNVTTVKD